MIITIAPTAKESSSPSEIATELFKAVFAIGLLKFKKQVWVCARVISEDGDVNSLLFLVVAHLDGPFD
jgi:hypothetical protein